MGIEQLFEEGKLFRKPQAQWYHEAIYRQSRSHCLRPGDGEISDVVDQLRPNESQSTKDFRIKNTKQITRGDAEMFLSKSSRIFQQSVQIGEISEVTKEWLDSKPFIYSGEQMGETHFLKEVIYKRATLSPNDILIAFPYNDRNELVPPILPESDGGVAKNERVPIKAIILSYDERLTDNEVVFKGGDMEIGEGRHKSVAPYYFAADDMNWWLFTPKIIEKKIEYVEILWYEHNTGENLLNVLPGVYSHSWDKQFYFKESFLNTYFEFADLALAAHSDDVIVRKRFSYPIVAMKRTQCMNEGCEGGYINRERKNPCGHCEKGYIYLPGPNGTLLKPDSRGPNADKSKDEKLIEFYNPDLSYAKNSIETPEFFQSKARRSLGLDLMEGAGANSSAEALRERKEDVQDLLNRIAHSLYACWDKFKWHVECLLVENEDKRIKPKTTIPQNIQIKDDFLLKQEAEQALPEDQINTRLEYYNRKYKDSPEKIRYYEILLCYTPYFFTPLEELQILIAKGICKDNDMIRKQYAAIALKSIQKENDLLDIKDDKAHEMMDAYLKDKGLIVEVAEVELFDGGAQQEESKLLQTVGGAQAAVALNQAVAEKKMTEAAAEKFMVKLFKVTAEEAAGLIDVPDTNNSDSDKSLKEGVQEKKKPLKQIINEAKTVDDLPEDLDEAEEALTKYIRGELSRELAIKILMITEGDTEEEAAFEIDNLKVGNKA